ADHGAYWFLWILFSAEVLQVRTVEFLKIEIAFTGDAEDTYLHDVRHGLALLFQSGLEAVERALSLLIGVAIRAIFLTARATAAQIQCLGVGGNGNGAVEQASLALPHNFIGGHCRTGLQGGGESDRCADARQCREFHGLVLVRKRILKILWRPRQRPSVLM